jgi:serine/threonine-protein kinase RsbT
VAPSSSLERASVSIQNEIDIVTARQRGREIAAQNGFNGTDQTLIATAISEIARNILTYAGSGEIAISALVGARRGIEVVGVDEGPGIADPELALRDGYSTQGSLGLGLPGAKRLMDEFELVTALGKGTRVTLRKWVP